MADSGEIWKSYTVCLHDACRSIIKNIPEVAKYALPSWIVVGLQNVLKAQQTYQKTLPLLEAEEKNLKYYVKMLNTERNHMSRLGINCWHAVQNAEFVEQRASKILSGIKTSGKVIWIGEDGKANYDKNTVMRMFKPEAYLVLVRTYIVQASNALSNMKMERLRLDVINSIADEKHRNDRRSAYFNACASEKNDPLSNITASTRKKSSNTGTGGSGKKRALRRSARLMSKRNRV